MSGLKLSTIKLDGIKKWSDDLALLYNADLNGSKLYTEVQSFKLQPSKLLTSLKTVIYFDFLKLIHQNSLPNVIILITY